MDAENKLLGSKPQLIVGVGPHTVLSGYKCYACKVRVNDTQIKSYTKIENDNGEVEVVTDDTFENVALIAGVDYIPFEDPITSITLNSATDSLMLFLERLN